MRNRVPVVLVAVALGATGCTFHHSLAVRYTPLIQAKRLADAAKPETIVVGEFADKRESKYLNRDRLNPISVHHLEVDTTEDVPALVRSAFLDGILKSGFSAPMAGESVPPASLTLSGDVLRYSYFTKTAWSKVMLTSTVEIDVVLKDGDRTVATIPAKGEHVLEAKSFGADSIVQGLDLALQAAVKSFLSDVRFHAIASNVFPQPAAGAWGGKTAQETPIAFRVDPTGIADVVLELKLQAKDGNRVSRCTETFKVSGPVTIDRGGFSAPVKSERASAVLSGAFLTAGSARGTVAAVSGELCGRHSSGSAERFGWEASATN
jgi:hypothetical protein